MLVELQSYLNEYHYRSVQKARLKHCSALSLSHLNPPTGQVRLYNDVSTWQTHCH